MKKTAIIYCRKSTNRIGRQENSIESQLKRNRLTAETENFAVLEEIIESHSAKNSNDRPGFNELMKYCNSGKVDYVIIDETDRLSRDDLDSAIFTTILRSGKIKGIFVGGKLISSEDMYGQFMFWLQLGASKLDNQQRSKKIIEKMQNAKNRGQILGQASYGYKNFTKDNGKKGLKIISEEVELGNRILELVVAGESLIGAAKKLFPLGLKTKTGKPWTSERVRHFISNHFYIGYAKFQGEYYEHKYPLAFNLELLKEAKTKIGLREYNPSKGEFLLKNKLKTPNNNPLVAYLKKGNTYYRNQAEKIHIGEKELIRAFGEVLNNFEIQKSYEKFIRKGLEKYYKEQYKQSIRRQKNLQKALKKLTEKKERLMSLFYAGGISEEGVKNEQEKFANEKLNLEAELSNIISVDDLILQESSNFIELFTNLSTKRKTMSYKGKLIVMDIIVVELFVDNKKRLRIQPNKLFDIIKNLNNHIWYSRQDSNPR